MELIPGLIDDVSKEMLNHFDGNTIHAISVVSKAWHVVVAKSIPDYISIQMCIEKARSGHYLYVAKHLTLSDKKDEYLKDTRDIPLYITSRLIINSILSGNIKMIKMLLTHLDINKYYHHWIEFGVPYAYRFEHIDVVELLLSTIVDKGVYTQVTCNEMLMFGICSKGDYIAFKTTLLSGFQINYKNIPNILYYAGYGGNIKIINELQSRDDFSIQYLVQGICASGKIELLEYLKKYSCNMNSWRLGMGGNMQIITSLSDLNLNDVFSGACVYNNFDVVIYILNKWTVPANIIINLLNGAWIRENEKILYVLLKVLIPNKAIFDPQIIDALLKSSKYVISRKVYDKYMSSFFSSDAHLF